MSFFDRLFGKKGSPASGPTFEELWSQLVPGSGQADTVQGELIRAVGKMRDELLRNGYANWDGGYEILSSFALARLTDGSFGPTTTEGVRKDIDAIQRYGRDESVTYDLEAAHDRLCEAAVAWCVKHPEPMRHEKREDLKR
jgi:hypothetical protein